MKKIIDVAKKIGSPSALTQEQGDIIFKEIRESILEKELIVLDFANVESIISPFLNNAIGQLYGEFTSDDITTYMKFENFPEIKNKTLNVVISNAKLFYANKKVYKDAVKEVLADE